MAAPDILDALYNHLVLPPKLPAKEDGETNQIEFQLMSRLLNTAHLVRDQTHHTYAFQYDFVMRSLKSCCSMNANHTLNKKSLLRRFAALQSPDVLILHVAEQNAGLLIWRRESAQEDHVIFEAFEASPTSESVFSTHDVLEWTFPGSSVSVPFNDFSQDTFQESLTNFLERASSEPIPRFAARAYKAGSSTVEVRDTTDPAMVTQLLTTILEANGHPTSTSLIRKRFRDDVCWDEGAATPWRRSPLWLVLRVGLRRLFHLVFGDEDGRIHYKFFVTALLVMFLDNAVGRLSPEKASYIKAKICRRLAKLEVDKERSVTKSKPTYDGLFTIMGPYISARLDSAIRQTEIAWNKFKKTNSRPVHPLPRRAYDRDFYFTLPNSGAYLQEVMNDQSYRNRQLLNPEQTLVIPNSSSAKSHQLQAFQQRYTALSEHEAVIENSWQPRPLDDDECAAQCIRIASDINKYIRVLSNHYDGNTEQMSVALLTVMELWIRLDQCAVHCFPLLEEFHPGFDTDILNVLQIPHGKDMRRIQRIQSYLEARHASRTAGSMTIFNDPSKGCFADRFFDSSPELQKLRQEIENDAEEKRKEKEEEWQEMSSEHDRLLRTIAESSCVFTITNSLPPEREHDDRGCSKCYNQRRAKRMRIRIHEHPLPTNNAQAKATIFELAIPKAFAAYRETTWKIIGALGRSRRFDGVEPQLLLSDYSELRPYGRWAPSTFSLASTTKSFLTSHYSSLRFPARLEDICLPCGLQLSYFDSLLRAFVGKTYTKPTFAHHCQIRIPSNSPFAILLFNNDFAVGASGPTSNAVVASQTKCPSGVNVHEFLSYQALFSGTDRRWLSILAELGSSNLNFSTEAVSGLISQLANQVGPAGEKDASNFLRKIHTVFHDDQFCNKLLDQISDRMAPLQLNWRENHCMNMLITLLLRVHSLAHKSIALQAVHQLEKAREITFKWTRMLHDEIMNAKDTTTAQNCSRYALWAAILCRRTFAVLIDDRRLDIMPHTDTCQTLGYGDGGISTYQPLLDSSALQTFIGATIALQNNMVSAPANLTPIMRSSLIWDTKLVYSLRYVFRESLERNPQCLIQALKYVWPEAENVSRRELSDPIFLPAPHQWWVTVMVTSGVYFNPQRVLFNLLEGSLTVDGQSLGRLADEHRRSPVIQLLFGDSNLQAAPSSMNGMSHVLTVRPNGYSVHVGYRNGIVIVRAVIGATVYEVVESNIFSSQSGSFDLPSSLVDGCVHFLDLTTGILEARRPNIWKHKSSTWRLNLASRIACRRDSTLISPHSQLFTRFARVFDGFEDPKHLTVYQPARSTLSVDLRRLELRFHVNREYRLETDQLHAEIDQDQDPGCFYGLQSTLIIRDVRNPSQRNVLVPKGLPEYRRNGMHVSVRIKNTGTYFKYSIDPILGRINCTMEPYILYQKAMMHAYTSFTLPDPLTGRTGTEEALHILSLGHSQPCIPLGLGAHSVLASISRLSPKRIYYPQHLKSMQRVFWIEALTVTIQHEGFAPLVESILNTSDQLAIFYTTGNTPMSTFSFHNPSHPELQRRASVRRCRFERSNAYSQTLQPPVDVSYDSRHKPRRSQERLNVFRIVNLIRSWPSQMETPLDLAGVLQSWSNIGGFDREFEGTYSLKACLTVEFDSEFGSIARYCQKLNLKDSHTLMFTFSLLAFGKVNMDIIRTWLAFAFFGELKALDAPQWKAFSNFRKDHHPNVEYIAQMLKTAGVQYCGDERDLFGLNLNFRQRQALREAEEQHKRQVECDSKLVAEFILEQWPCIEPSVEGFNIPVLLKFDAAMSILRPEFLRLYQNLHLSNYISQVQQILDNRRGEEPCGTPSESEGEGTLSIRLRGGEVPKLSSNLLRKCGPSASKVVKRRDDETTPSTASADFHAHRVLTVLPNGNIQRSLPTASPMKPDPKIIPQEAKELGQILTNIVGSKSTLRQQYAKDLRKSLMAFVQRQNDFPKAQHPRTAISIEHEKLNAKQIVQQRYTDLCHALEAGDPGAKWLQYGLLWPCMTTVELLEQLRSTAGATFGDQMREDLTKFALSLTKLQRLLRMEDAEKKKNSRKLVEEMENPGHLNWQPLEHPDWLLLELEVNILIREDQVTVALETISPASGANSVLQMNMGQGKTSCIIPMVSAQLANSKRLMRVIVPRPLLPQTATLLLGRLGGLLGRQIRHIPYSRKTNTCSDTTKTYLDIHEHILRTSGVMLAAPEHLLSFKLCGLQRLSDGRIDQATPMINIQTWLSNHARDLADESDFIFSPRTALCFPSGNQSIVDGHPHRWETAEALLVVVQSHLWSLQKEYPQSIELIVRESGGYPFIFFLQKTVEDALISKIVMDICNGRTSILPIRECSRTDRLAIKEFISKAKPSQTVIERIRNVFPEKPEMRKKILLIRGLLVHRILLMTLKKRWNVQYGIDPKRDPIAVPFNAKGVPSEQSEWGHPDVAILFSILAHYYSGLSIDALHQSLDHVSKSDDPAHAYDSWIHSCGTLPDSLRDWDAINTDDETQLTDIWKHVRYNTVVIDFYLNNFVFPRHAKQFRIKLQASGWDLPLLSIQPAHSVVKTEGFGKQLTTGFSGTNDNREMLPLTIKQQDLPSLSHTSAEVLTYLLQPRNRHYVLAADYRGRRLDEMELLEKLKKMRIRVLIDSGAQVLEMSNEDVAKNWLDIDNEAPAAVYFDSDNKAMVLYRQGIELPLLATPYAEDLSEVLVYIDESHTRGIDLKLADGARGALTLGMSLQKDALMQSAMRLRQLGTTQSITFLAPPEVHQSILDLRKLSLGAQLDSVDVIHWLLDSTCEALESMSPLFYAMGVDFCQRSQSALDNPDFLKYNVHRDAYLEVLRQTEKKTLRKLYEPKIKSKSERPTATVARFTPQLGAFMKELNKRRKAFYDSGNAVHASALQEVEQEREVAIEVEVEAIREVQKPVHYQPHKFDSLHRDIVKFVKTGRLAAGSAGFEHAFMALRRTAVGIKYGVNLEAMNSQLFSTIEFSRTVMCPTGKPNDSFVRLVQWVLWSTVTNTALLVCPEEAELLIPLCREIRAPVVYLATYAAPVNRKMLHFNGLTFCATPALPDDFKAPTWLTVQLGFLAGRLYFEWDEYEEMRDFLGLTDDHLHDDDDELDAMLKDDADAEMPTEGPMSGVLEGKVQLYKEKHAKRLFTNKPLAFLQEWIAARRKNQDWTHTPVGFLAQGKTLTSSHPFFSKHGEDDQCAVMKAPVPSARQKEGGGDIVEKSGGEDVVDDDDLFFDGEIGAHELLDDEEEGDVDFSAWDRLEQEEEGEGDSKDDDDVEDSEEDENDYSTSGDDSEDDEDEEFYLA